MTPASSRIATLRSAPLHVADDTGATRTSPRKVRREGNRYAAVPLECRGVLSAYDPRTDSATIWSSTQVVHWVRREAAALLGLPEARVREIAQVS